MTVILNSINLILLDKMLRINKLTDYGVVIMAQIANEQMENTHTARDIAEGTKIPLPTVTALLKKINNAGFLESKQGAMGGYTLSITPDKISIYSLIEALEGPVAITECSTEGDCDCELLTSCETQKPWQKINDAVKMALSEMTLEDMNANKIKNPLIKIGNLMEASQ